MTARGRRAGDALRRFPMKVGGGFGPTPPITSGMVFWGNLLSPDTSIISTAVATLGDSSGNGRHFTQGTAANRPAYNASDANFGGQPSMTLNGTSNTLAWASGFPAMANTTMYAVTRSITVDATARRMFEVAPLGAAGGLSFIAPASTNELRSRFDSSAALNSNRAVGMTPASANRYAAVGALSAGGALWTTYINGAASGTDITTLAGAGVSSAVAASYIGSMGGSSSYFFGTIATIIVYNTAHTATEVRRVDAWLKWRFGL